MMFVRSILCLCLCLVFLPVLAVAQTADPNVSKLPFDKKLKLAKIGDEVAKMAVAEAYERGIGTTPDLALAARWYREAALVNNVEAQYRLARIVRVGANGLKKDEATAIKLITLSANNNHLEAQNEMGLIHLQGAGVEKNIETARNWFQRAADKGHPVAATNLALILLFNNGDKPDAKQALGWLEKSAEAGDGLAINNLAALYEQGWGTTKNIPKARALYIKAAAKGIAAAEVNLKRLEGSLRVTVP